MSDISTVRQMLKKPKDRDLDVGTELDATINFRVNSKLKKKFESVCKANHSSVSRELKLYMSKVLANGRFR